MKESDLYEPVKEYFSDLGYAIYAEVEVRYCGGRVDVVAYNHPAAIAIELKQSLSFELIEQAMARKAVFPYVYIAYPARKKEPPKWLVTFFREQGIGLLEVESSGRCDCILGAKYRKPTFSKWRVPWAAILKKEHQEWVPGGHAGGGYVTNYALTMRGVKNYLWNQRRTDEKIAGIMNKIPEYKSTDGWRTVSEILEHCETHYLTPKNGLAQGLVKFEWKWCETKKEKGKLYFRYKVIGDPNEKK